MELQSRVKELAERGLGLAVISYDAPDILRAFGERHGITFPLLSDGGSATIKRYGILNPYPALALGPEGQDPAITAAVRKYVTAGGNPRAAMAGIAFPGTFVLDREGRVTSRFFEDFYIERSTVASVLLKLGAGAAPVNATKISTAHLEATSYASDVVIAPGNRITLTVDITPRPGMHVYAPGASGYRVVSLELEPQPFVRALPVKYPPSEIYLFAPLNERVNVYQTRFTLHRDVVLEGTSQARAAMKDQASVTVSGRLDYQACDEKICYNPVSLPVSWTMSLRPLVPAR